MVSLQLPNKVDTNKDILKNGVKMIKELSEMKYEFPLKKEKNTKRKKIK